MMKKNPTYQVAVPNTAFFPIILFLRSPTDQMETQDFFRAVPPLNALSTLVRLYGHFFSERVPQRDRNSFVSQGFFFRICSPWSEKAKHHDIYVAMEE
jgi:hypothetical protein